MIDPTAVSTIRVGELSPEPFSLTDNIPHEVGTELKRGTIEDLATFISTFIGSTDGVGFRAISVTDGQTLPTTTQQEFILVGKGTYYNVVGGSTIICTEELNAIVSNGSYWFIGVEIPVNVELAGITQFIRDGFISTTPSEDAVYDALALKANVADSEDVTNKVSAISTYSTTLYPNEKATHDALDLKLNISDLPTNLTLYPTNVASDVSGYVKMVTNIHDADYNVTAVDISTPTITTTDQLVASLITDAGVLIGQPGVFNATTFGNIRRLSGSGTATFYFKVFHRDSIGTETLIGTSSNTEVITSSSYLEFTGALLWDDGDFIATDRIVIKYYANRIAGSSDPVYQFQFGGATPVRTLLPVPFSVVDAGYELKANKQDDLTIDGTGTKYPTVDAVNTIDLQKVLGDIGKEAFFSNLSGNQYVSFFNDDEGASKIFRLSSGSEVGYSEIDIRDENISLINFNQISQENASVGASDGQFSIFQTGNSGATSSIVSFLPPLVDTTLNFPAKTEAGTYTLATTDEVEAVDAKIPTTYSKVVYVNATSPTTATIFDTENPPVTNDNLLKNDTANLYIGTDASTWVYLTGTGYVTKTVSSATSNFNTFGTTVDAGNSKTSHITRSGAMTLTGPLNILNLKIATTPSTSAGSYDILTRNSSTTALEKKLVSDFIQTTGNQSMSGDKTFTGVLSAKTIFVSSQNSGYSVYLDNAFGGNGFEGRNYSGGNFIYATPGSGNGFYFNLTSGATGVGGKINSHTTATGNLLEFQKNTVNTTVINHLGEIITMSPTATNQVATKGYTDAKITQTITNGVTDKSPSEDAVFDAFQNYSKIILKNTTTSTPVTGTLSQTILFSQLIPANTFKNGDFFNIILSRVGKVGTAGTLTQTIRINTSNTLTGSTIIASNLGTSANLNQVIGRRFSIEGASLKGFAGGSASSDMINSSAAIASYTFDPTVDNYIFEVGQLTDNGDSMFHSSFILTN